MASTREVESAVKGVSKIWPTVRDRPGMIGAAVVFDVLSAIPVAGVLFSGLGYATLWLWMEIEGMKPGFSGDLRQIAKKAGSIIAEITTSAIGFGFVPGIAIWAFFVIAEHKAETDENAAISQEEIDKTKEQFSSDKDKQPKQKQRTKTSAYF